MKKDLIKTIITMIILYSVQFLILPRFFTTTGNEGWIGFFITTLLCVIVGIIFLSDKLILWFLGDFIYLILLFIYHPAGAYGIGMKGLDLVSEAQSRYSRADAWLLIFILFAINVVFQIVIWVLKKLCLLIYYMNKRNL